VEGRRLLRVFSEQGGVCAACTLVLLPLKSESGHHCFILLTLANDIIQGCSEELWEYIIPLLLKVEMPTSERNWQEGDLLKVAGENYKKITSAA